LVLYKKMNKQTTIIYYSSNQENKEFEQKITDTLIKNSNGIPIVSVSQIPMNLGTNVCVGKLPFCGRSLLFQISTGLKKAKTKFCLAAESDFIYPPEYFNFIPPTEHEVYHYENIWIKWLRPHHNESFCKKLYFSEGAQICGREYWIEQIEKILKSSDSQDPGIPFNTKYSLSWTSNNPAISFKTGNGLHQKTPLNKKIQHCLSFPYWGDCKEFI